MLNGLLVDLGADVELLHTELEKMGVDGFHLHVHRVAKSAIWGTDFDVHLHRSRSRSRSRTSSRSRTPSRS